VGKVMCMKKLSAFLYRKINNTFASLFSPNTYSLQVRLIGWLASILIVLFALHTILVSYLPRWLAEKQILTRLEHDSQSLISRLNVRKDGSLTLGKRPISPTYRMPYSGHYFQLDTQSQRLTSPSLVDQHLSIKNQWVEQNNTHYLLPTTFSKTPLLALSTRFTITNNTQPIEITLTFAEDISQLDQAIKQSQLIYLLIAIIILIVIIFLQRLIIIHHLKPIKIIHQELQSIEQGKINHINETPAREIKPLVEEINHLLNTLQKRLIRSRHAVGNLAHSLKAPLALLTQINEQAAIKQHPEIYRELKQTIARLQINIDRELKQARLSGHASVGQAFEVKKHFYDLIAVLEKIYFDKQLVIQLNTKAQTYIYADQADMLELFGNLLDNACKWAKQCVVIEVLDKPYLHCLIDDDGKGIDPAELARLQQRGQRLDEQILGHGLGLSIVQDIISQYQGELHFRASSQLSGLQVEVILPYTKKLE